MTTSWISKRSSEMDDNSSTSSQPASTIPPDDPRRALALARPDEDQNLPHISLSGGTYTILLTGEDTAGRYALIDMHVPSGGPSPHRREDDYLTFRSGCQRS